LQFRDATLNVSSTADGQLDLDADAELELVAPIVDIDATTEVNISGELKVGGKISSGADGSGVDVVFYSNTTGDEFTWDASEEKLIIDGTEGYDALTIAEGNVTVANNITATNITATAFIGNGSSLTGVPASTIGTLPGASPLELEGETADGYETTITVTDPTADRTITLPNADGTVSLTGVSETLSNKTLIGPIVAGSENSSGSLHIYADDGDDDNDKWRLETANGGNMTIDSKQSSSWSTLVTLGNTGALTVTGAVTASGFSGDGSALTGVPAASISTLSGASPLVLEGSTVNDYETTIAVTDPTADRTLTLPNATGTLATITGTETFTNKTLTSPDINGGTVDGAAIGASSASTGAFTTASASTAIQTPLIEYTDGDDAITIADGGAVTTSGALTVTGLVTGSSLDVDDVVVDGTTIGHTDDTDLMTLASGTLTVAGTVAATTLTGDGSGIDGVQATSIGTLAGANPLVLEGATADDYETTITVTDPTADRTLTLPNATGTLATITGTETFTNKTLTSPDINGGTVDGAAIGASSASTGAFTSVTVAGASPLVLEGATADDYETTITVTDPTADRTLTLPNVSSTLATTTGTETFTNKTLTSPDINGGTVDGAAIGASSASTGAFTTASASTAIQTPLIEYTDGDDAITIADGGGVTANAGLAVKNGATSAGGVSFYENSDNGTNYMKLQAGSMSADVTLTLPTADGSSGQFLSTNGSGTLSWGSVSASLGDLSDALDKDNSLYLGNDPSSSISSNTAEHNAAFGKTALDAITDGDRNTAIGYDALTNNTEGFDNVAIGYQALKSNQTGDRNIAIGRGTLFSNTVDYNVAVGHSAMYANTDGTNNTALGYNAVYANITGDRNIGIGYASLDNADTENDNLAIGYDALGGSIAGGEFNVGIGNYSMDALTSGDGNTGIGYNAMTALTTGDGNVSLGRASGTTITTGSNNTVIGKGADVSANGAENQVVIGQGASGQASNSVVLGNASVTAVYMAQDKGATAYGATFEASTGIIPDAADGAYLGTTSAEFSDLFLADGSVINLGNDQDVTVTHDADDGLELKSAATADDNPFLLTIKSGETDIATDDVIGTINFQAPDEATGTDAILVAAGIEAISEGDFSSSSNATKLSFKTASSEAAAEKMSLSSAGNLTVSGDLGVTGNDISFGNGESISNATDGSLTIGVGGNNQLSFTDGTITPTNNYDINLGTSSYQFADLYVDGTANLDYITLGGSITPTINNNWSLGNSSYQFYSLYVDGVANLDQVRTGLIEYNDGDDAITISDGGDMDFNGNTIEDFSASIYTDSGGHTLVSSNNGRVLVFTSNSAVTLTVPSGLPVGFNCLIVQKGSGQVTLSASSTNIYNRNSHTKTAGQYAIMTLVSISSNTFISSGDGGS